VASYLLNDAIADDILAGLVLYPSSCSPSRCSAPRRARACASAERERVAVPPVSSTQMASVGG
jgi:hypothetical protein